MLLPASNVRHVLGADQTSDQTTEVRRLGQHDRGVHAAVGLDGLQRADRAQVDELAQALPQGVRRACEKAAATVDDQDRGLSRLLHLVDRLVDADRIDGHARNADCTGGRIQWNAQNEGDVALLVVACAANTGALQDAMIELWNTADCEENASVPSA